MTNPSRVFCVVAIAMAVSSVATAQAVTAFDGTYQGVSTIATSCGAPPASPVPGTLTISNGAAQFNAGMYGALVFNGNVTAAGELRMQDQQAHLFEGKISPNGRVVGNVLIGSNDCVITGVWQKQK
jgi:hypothetical protein